MLSRVAESIYWMNRYVERAENVARFIDVSVNLAVGGSEFAREPSGLWLSLISTTGDDVDFRERYGHQLTRDNVVKFLLFDEANGNSIFSCIMRARENARAIRQVIPSVVWEQLNRFYIHTKAAAKAENIDTVQDFCDEVRLFSHTLTGAADATMSTGEPWQFARLGRMLERADKTSRIVDVQYYSLLPEPYEVGSTLDIIRWSALLKSTSALAMYRRQYGTISPSRVAELLILDRFFPRSIHHCVLIAQQSLASITGCPPGTFTNSAERYLGLLNASMDYSSVEEIIATGLHEFIDGLQSRLNEVSVAIGDDFFTWTTPDVDKKPTSPISFLQHDTG